MSLRLWNSRFSVTLVRQHSTIFTSAGTIKTTSGKGVPHTNNYSHFQQQQQQSQQQQQRRNLTTTTAKMNPNADKGKTNFASSKRPGDRNSMGSSLDSTASDPPFNHPHCDRQAQYQQTVKKVRALRGKLEIRWSYRSLDNIFATWLATRSHRCSLTLSFFLSLSFHGISSRLTKSRISRGDQTCSCISMCVCVCGSAYVLCNNCC